MTVSTALLKDLQRQQKALEVDLRTQSEQTADLASWLQDEYAAARRAERTGVTYRAWLDEQVMQAAAAWLLGTVFVRFCEDNGLIDSPWLSGPGDRAAAAGEAQTAYFLQYPTHNDRQWILASFDELASFPAASALFDEHSLVRRIPISGDAARALLAFWRKRGAGGELVHDFTDSTWNTRFLGDLYQDLSEKARKQYALLQTPDFVEEFLLDLTLTQSLREYGLVDTSVIDPTCGSGHFLLGSFERLANHWADDMPGMDVRERVQKALDQVAGVDINPFAVAIARFRLTVAAIQKCGLARLREAPAFNMRLATGDSLLYWDTGDAAHQGDLLASAEEQFTYFTEDSAILAELLKRGQYTVAVGNPPYITVKDKVLNRRYRSNYPLTSGGQYHLSGPFLERFFQLVRPRDNSARAGFVGQISDNAFMKRESGKKLIERYLPTVELTHVIDTSGAFIPGHGTPTVLMVGRRRLPTKSKLRAVLGVSGEPSAPVNPSEGRVWRAIVDGIDAPGSRSPYVTIVDKDRSSLARHPWSLVGGGAHELQAGIENAAIARLDSRVASIGFMAVTREDDAYFLSSRAASRLGISSDELTPVSGGSSVRDWRLDPDECAIFPYSADGKRARISDATFRHLWCFQRYLAERRALSGTQAERGLTWFEYSDFHPERWSAGRRIGFSFVATHNQFSDVPAGNLLIRTAPMIQLGADVSEDEHIGLLGLLNSSTSCFWLKQVSHGKGNGGVNEGYRGDEWEEFYEFTGTKLKSFPIATKSPLEISRKMGSLALEMAGSLPESLCSKEIPTLIRLEGIRRNYEHALSEMIALQEELDWQVYRLYDLLDEELEAPLGMLPELKQGERAFEILLARKVAAGEIETQWFARHGITPITKIPEQWHADYREIVQKRIEIIEKRPDLGLIERPQCKRRWSSDPWEKQQQAALRSWLLDRLEGDQLWREDGRARVLPVSLLADLVRTDGDFRSVLDIYVGRDDYDLAEELAKLVADEVVPFLARLRYKPASLWKRREWERTWDLQRKEDADLTVGEIAIPPKYTSADFAKTAYWRNRGKLDVPKERFVLYPNAGRDTDKSPVIGWAGWDHVDKAQALATLYLERQGFDGWPTERLLPLLAGLVELEPWLHQWHHESDPTYSGSPADFYTAFLDQQLTKLGRSRADLGGIDA